VLTSDEKNAGNGKTCKNQAYMEKPVALGMLSNNVAFSSLETGIDGFGFGDKLFSINSLFLSCLSLAFMGCIF
jgi:hypothetical protein